MFNPQHYENTQPGGVAEMEIVGPEGAAPAFVPLQHTTVRGVITGPLADLQVTHRFGYRRAESDQTLEARYRFPLPGDAAVMAVVVRFGEVEIAAELKERRAAEEDYAQAKSEGRQAALATRESADAFTLQITGLQPDQAIVVETSYVQLARPQGVGWTLRIPLTLAPRYARSDELRARHAQGQPLALVRDPGHRFALDLVVAAANAVASPTHELASEPAQAGLRLQLAAGDVIPDRDCVITWQPVAAAQHALLTPFAYTDQPSGWQYFIAQVAPPAMQRAGQGEAREVTLLVDHSGSMTGPKWAAADWAVERFLAGLTARDQFALGYFHNTTHWFNKRLQTATPEQTGRAVAWLKSQRDNGGTELGVALEQALAIQRAPGEQARNLLIVTDAEVTDAARILRLADAEAQQAQRRRISVLCIDAAPNAYLAQELADRGGGLARFLTSDPDQEDITTALDEVLADWSEPVLTGLSLVVNRADVETSGRHTLQTGINETTIDLGDLVAGRGQWVVGRARLVGNAQLSLAVYAAQGRLLTESNLERTQPGTAAIKALFGARRIAALEHLIAAGYDEAELRAQLGRIGYDPATVLGETSVGLTRVYAENQREATAQHLRTLLRDEALAYHLVSSETAFVATRREAGQLVSGTIQVANALPVGWSPDFLTTGGAPVPAGMVRYAAANAPLPALSVAPPFAQAGTLVDKLVGRMASSKAKTAPAPTYSDEQTVTIFTGALTWRGREAVLVGEEPGAGSLPATATITALRLMAKGVTPDEAGQVRLLIYLGDLASPRAQVLLRDLLQLGERPLNLRRHAGQPLTITLRDEAGSLAGLPIELTVELRWRPSAGG